MTKIIALISLVLKYVKLLKLFFHLKLYISSHFPLISLLNISFCFNSNSASFFYHDHIFKEVYKIQLVVFHTFPLLLLFFP